MDLLWGVNKSASWNSEYKNIPYINNPLFPHAPQQSRSLSPSIHTPRPESSIPRRGYCPDLNHRISLNEKACSLADLVIFLTQLYFYTSTGKEKNEDMEKKDILKNSILFAELQEKDLDAIADIAVIRVYEKGQAVFSEGDQADTLFVLGSGRVEVFKLSSDGKKQVLRIVLPGEIFAEAAVFSGGSYPAYADATTHSEMLCITQSEFLKLLQTNPQLSMSMLGALANLLRGFTGMIEDLCLRDVSARVAKFILDRSMKTGKDFFQLEMKMGELAQKICTVSETLSRTLRKMRLKGIIDVRGKTITILDKEALHKIVSGMKI
jgi:CRP-like cAMP-binding protein